MGRSFFEGDIVNLKSAFKSYLYFLAFAAITKSVVKPMAVNANIPLLKDL
jgi:hypothetical protein